MKEKELTLEEAEKIVDTMYQNRFVEAGVEEGNTIHLGNMDNIEFTDLESASIYLLRKEISLRKELQRKDNIINELEERNNKAIEFIDEFWKKNSEYYSVENCLEFCEFDKEDLLSILRGDK